MKVKFTKQQFREYTKSFSFRILIILLSVTLLPLLVLGFYSMHFVKNTLNESSIQSSKVISEHFINVYQENIIGHAQQIDLELKNIEKMVMLVKSYARELYTNKEKYRNYDPLQLVKEKEGYYWDQNTDKNFSNVGASGHFPLTEVTLDNLARSVYLEPLFRQTVEENDHISAIYFIMPNASWRIFPALNMIQEIEQKYFNPNIPVTNYSFYISAISNRTNSNEIVWTDPYTDITHRDMMFSATTAIYDDSDLIGVIGADITIEAVIKNILDIKFNDSEAYAFLVNKEGILIALQDHGKDHFEQNEIYKYFEDGYIPETNMTLDDGNILLSSRIPTTGWYLGYVIHEDSLVAPIHDTTNEFVQTSENQIFSHITATSLLLIALCIYLAILLWSSIIKPIRELIIGISKLGKGRTSVQIKNTEMTEFKKLINAFNTMSSQIDFLLNQLEKRIHEKELLHDELKELNLKLEHKVLERTEELKKTNAELLKRNEQLKNIQQSRAELISNLSHDLKTPLTIISGYVEAFLDGMIEQEKQPIYLEKINQKIISLNRLAKDLYELSLLESNKMILKIETTSIGDIIDQLAIRWRQNHDPVERYTVELINSIVSDAERSLMIELDIVYLNRAIENILENAYKYGNNDVPIRMKTTIAEHHLIIQISNQGAGIRTEHLPHVFKRTYRVDKSRNSKKAGHGLGLAIVKEIIDAHNGTITVESELGKTTTFTISLPLI